MRTPSTSQAFIQQPVFQESGNVAIGAVLRIFGKFRPFRRRHRAVISIHHPVADTDMQTYWLTDRTSGEATLVDSDTVERLLGVEFGYVEWCIGVDGMFENGKWKVLGGKVHKRAECCRSLHLRSDSQDFPKAGIR